MTHKELLDLYRKKRAVDGLNGREWHAEKHLKYDKAIELEESRHLTSKSSGENNPVESNAFHPIHDTRNPFESSEG